MRTDPPRRQGGLVLLVVLWVMIVLTLIGTSYFHLSSIEVQSSRNDLEKLQAGLLAESALQYAMAVLDTESSTLGYHDLNSNWAGGGELFEATQFGEGAFQIYADDVTSEEGGTRFGLRDESSKLNINVAPLESIQKLPNMTNELAAAIVDWRDADDSMQEGGAEREYYTNLSNPYEPRNGPFQSVAELMRVKGCTPRVLYGEDANRDGELQGAEDDGGENYPPDNGDGELDRGLLPYVTVNSYVENVNALGQPRLNVNTASNGKLRRRLKDKISKKSLNALIRYRRDYKFEDLVQVMTGEGVERPASEKKSRKKKTENADGSTSEKESKRSGRNKRNNKKESSAPDSSEPESETRGGGEGETLSEDLPEGAFLTFDEFRAIADDLTMSDEESVAGRLNVNTAPLETLVCLPGMTNEIAERIVDRRSSDLGAFESAADLARIEGIDAELLGKLFERVTVRSTVFEALAVGYLPKSKAYVSIEAKIDRGGGRNKFSYYRIMR